MTGTLARVVLVAAAALAGASVWISLGTMAVTQGDSRMRIVALPPLYLLGLLVVSAAASAWTGRVSGRRLRPLSVTALLWLPYVPGHIPDAFLIWQGPIEGLVWLAVAAGLIIDAPWSQAVLRHKLVVDPASAPGAAVVLSAILFTLGAMALADRLPNGDEPHYLMISQSVLHDGDLQIQNNHDRVEYRSFASNELQPHYVARGTNGQIYSVHSPGVAVMVLPAFALFGYAGASATMVAVAGVTAGLVWRGAWLLTASAMAAWVSWASVCLAAPFFLQAFTVFPDLPGALCVAVSLGLLLRLEFRGAAGIGATWLAGAALAALPWLHSRFVILAVAMGAVLGLRLARQRPGLAARLFCIPLFSAIAWLGYFWTIWGTLNPSAPYGTMTDLAWRNIATGGLGLMVDQRSGLLATAPALVCAFAGMIGMARQRPRLAAEVVIVAIPYVVAVSAYRIWWGGFGAPARYLVPLLPIVALPVAWMWSTAGPMWRALTAMLALTGIAMLVARTTIADGGSMAFASVYGSDPLLAWAAPSVSLSAALPSLRSATVWRDVLVWLVVCVLISGGTFWAGIRWQAGSAVGWVLVSSSAALALMIGSTVIWRSHGTSGLAPANSQLTLVRHWSPQSRSTTVQWRPPYVVSPRQLMRRIDVPATLHAASQSTHFSDSAAAPVFGAADYSIVLHGAPPLRGEVVVRIGDTNLSLERWRLDDIRIVPAELRLRLPVPVSGVSIHGDDAAVASVSKASIRVAEVVSRALIGWPPARRAVRYGDIQAFFLDDRAYPEPTGFWTRGKAETTVIFNRDDSSLSDSITLRLQSGPIGTTVALTIADGRRRVVLGPHERQEMSFPVGRGERTVPVSVRTAAMFLPVEHDARNRDFRQLGVWVEVR